MAKRKPKPHSEVRWVKKYSGIDEEGRKWFYFGGMLTHERKHLPNAGGRKVKVLVTEVVEAKR